jgi:DNA replication protein DnaC
MQKLTVDKEALRRLDARIEAAKAEERKTLQQSARENTSPRFSVRIQVDHPDFVCAVCGEACAYEALNVFGDMWQYRRPLCACEREAKAQREADDAAEAEYRKRQERQDTIRAFRSRSGIAGKYLGYTLDTCPSKPAVEVAHEFLRRYPTPRGFWLQGPNGIGKTAAATGTGLELIGRCVEVSLWPAFGIFDALKRAFDVNDPDETPLTEQLGKVPLLIIDDFGNHRIPSDDRGDWAREQMFKILYARDTFELPVIVTTKFTEAELIDRYDTDTISRLHGTAGKPVILTGEDQRPKAAENWWAE